MRILFLTLLVLNLGFLGYHLAFSSNPPEPASEALPGEDVTQLEPLPPTDDSDGADAEKDEAPSGGAASPEVAEELVRESGGDEKGGESGRGTNGAEEGSSTSAEEEAAQPIITPVRPGSGPGDDQGARDEESPQPVCYALGPLTSETRDRIKERAASSPLEIVERWDGQRSETRYWVHLPPAPDMEGARERQEALKEAGYPDNLVVRNGELARSISLGLFAKRTNAEDLRDRLKDDGFDARIRDQERRTRAPFLGLRVPDDADEALADIREFIESEDARLTERPCDGIRKE
ncbi:SPOR domain-containing protein [Thiohalospira sp.]|uniref:SPOR domain-containing protein n=1 Tax=Thiohalospira sp. TaxID=3080549 RepID=UPI00397FEBFC